MKIFLEDLGCLLFSVENYSIFDFTIKDYFLGFNKGIVNIPEKILLINYLHANYELKFSDERRQPFGNSRGYVSEHNPYFEIEEDEDLFYLQLKYSFLDFC